jgi:uncharacterized heparinase superfamily protein
LSLALYYHTLRHLRPSQVVGRAWFALHRPRPDTSPAPRRRPIKAAVFPLPPLREGSLVDENVFRFLNIEGPLSDAAAWNDPSADRLWLYNLHYFDDLNAAGRGRRRAWHVRLVARWIAENPPGFGTGWEPYPLSLRIVNWIKWACSGFSLSDAAVHSLAVQARYLRRRLEHHLLGNHLLANAKALVFAGLFFDGDESKEWLAAGLGILERELTEQVLADGGHFERSPMYHSIVLEDVLDLLAMSRVFPSVVPPRTFERWSDVAGRMLTWLAAMCHPDGDIAFFNDSAFGIALTPSQLGVCARTLGLRISAPPDEEILRLEPSGYVRIRRDRLQIIFDAAPVGADYIPGHAHADTLSFELSLGTVRVLTNSGISTYAFGPRRAWQRSTAAHNTVEIDGEDSSEVWSAFRVARRARPFDLAVERSGEALHVACSHDGYRRLKGEPVHRRVIELREGALRLRVADSISGTGIHRAAGHFHFHPGIRVEEGANGDWMISLPQGTQWRMVGNNGLRLKREEGEYALEFGKSIARPVLVWRIEGQLPIAAVVEIFEER